MIYRKKSSLTLQRAVVMLCAALSVNSSASFANGINEKQSFNIAPQSLAQALKSFSQRSGLQLFYDASLVDGKISTGLHGSYTSTQALAQLLSQSGLDYQIKNANTVVLEKRREEKLILAAADNIQSSPPANQKKVAQEKVEEPTVLETVNVTDKAKRATTDPYNKDYAISNAFTASKTDTPIMHSPMNIQVVSKSIINDQQNINITDAITKNVSGVQANKDSGVIYDNFTIRGFGSGDIYRNGLLRGFGTYDPANIEQLEVIKGPASMLYGRGGNPGGLVNYVTKKGLDTPYYSLQQQFGSYDQYRTTLDATAPIDKEGKLRYRVNFSYQDIGSFKQFINDERYFIAPTLSWRPNDSFEANLELEHKHERKVDDWGIPSIGNRPAPVPLNRSYQDSAKKVVMDTTLVAYDWTFKFNDDWKVKNRFLWENWDTLYNEVGTDFLDVDNRTLNRFYRKGPATQETYATNLDIIGKFNLWGTQHEVLLGGDFYQNTFGILGVRYLTAPSIDIFNPVYGVVDEAAAQAQPPTRHLFRKEQRFGVYFQDSITLFEKLHIMGGGRYDWVTYGTGFSPNSFAEAKGNFSSQEDQKFSPRVGVLYQPWNWLSLYSSYTQSLGFANQGQSFSGQTFKPEEAEQYEAGFKTEFFDKKLSSTVSFYNLTKTNTITNDPAHPGFAITAGKVRSRGIEVDIKGQVTENLNLVTTYAFTDIRYVNADAPLLGQRPINVPEHQATLWGTYQFTEHFKAGLGGVLVGKRLGDNYNPVDLPGYVTMDLMAAYTQPLGKAKLTAQININNVLDKGYYLGSGYGRDSIVTGNPLSAMGSLKIEY